MGNIYPFTRNYLFPCLLSQSTLAITVFPRKCGAEKCYVLEGEDRNRSPQKLLVPPALAWGSCISEWPESPQAVLSSALGNRGTTYGVSHKAGALWQPMSQNPSSYPVSQQIIIQSPEPGAFQGLGFFLATWKLPWLNVSDFSPKLLL